MFQFSLVASKNSLPLIGYFIEKMWWLSDESVHSRLVFNYWRMKNVAIMFIICFCFYFYFISKTLTKAVLLFILIVDATFNYFWTLESPKLIMVTGRSKQTLRNLYKHRGSPDVII